MNCREARDLMSDYLEQVLAEPEASLLRDHLAGCSACREELADLDTTLRVVHGLPRQEPVIDLWQEFAPKFAEIRANSKLSPSERVSEYFSCLFGAIREGWMIFVTVVRYSTNDKMQRYFSGNTGA